MNQVFAYNGGRVADPEAPAVVLIHGAGMDHTVWHSLSRPLAHQGWRVMAVDLPGHGRSTGPCLSSVEEMADWLGAFVSASDLDRFTLIGHSLGGLVALRTAAFDSRVERLVLIATGAEIAVHADLQSYADRCDPKAIELILSWSFGNAGRIGGHTDPGTSALVVSRRTLQRNLATSLASDLRATGSYRTGAADAAHITCPPLILAGSEDRMIGPPNSSLLAAMIPGARYKMVPGGGHMLMIQQPDEVRNAVVNFLGAE